MLPYLFAQSYDLGKGFDLEKYLHEVGQARVTADSTGRIAMLAACGIMCLLLEALRLTTCRTSLLPKSHEHFA